MIAKYAIYAKDIWSELHKLDEFSRTVIELRLGLECERCTFAEIAHLFGIRTNRAERAFRHGLEIIKRRFVRKARFTPEYTFLLSIFGEEPDIIRRKPKSERQKRPDYYGERKKPRRYMDHNCQDIAAQPEPAVPIEEDAAMFRIIENAVMSSCEHRKTMLQSHESGVHRLICMKCGNYSILPPPMSGKTWTEIFQTVISP